MHANESHLAGPITAIAKDLSHLRGEPVHALVTTPDDTPLLPAVAQTVIHQVAPGETQGSLNRFFDHWKPDLGVILGVPDRPKLVKEAARRNVLLYLTTPKRGAVVDARRLAYLPVELLTRFKTSFAASTVEADVLKRHLDGAPLDIEVLGPLTDTTHALPCDEAECDALASALAGRPIWLAAGISTAELGDIEAAHRKAFSAAHRLLLILAPRALEEAPQIADALEAKGWSTALRSHGTTLDLNTQILIADMPDEMGLWHRLAPTTFVGGTFDTEATPSDPFDPATLGSAVLHGPEIGKASARFMRLTHANASLLVRDATELGMAIQSLLSPDKAAALAQAGWATTTESAEVVERMVELMDIHLDEQEAQLAESNV